VFERGEYLDDVRMIQLAQHFRFALEAIERTMMTPRSSSVTEHIKHNVP